MTDQNGKQEETREEFPDSSAVVTFTGGSMLIVESSLSKFSALRETKPKPTNYNDPPPPPP